MCFAKSPPYGLRVIVRASLRDAVPAFGQATRALETPGYFRISLRDTTLLRRFRNISSAGGRFWVASGFEEVPGFFVGGVFLVGAAGGEEEVAAERDDNFGGEDVPDVFEDQVDGEEVDLAPGVELAAAGFDGDDVSAVGAGNGGFDLDTEKMSAALDGDVIAGGISLGLGSVKPALGDAGHEIEFGPLAAMLGVFDDDAAAAVGWERFIGDELGGGLAVRFPSRLRVAPHEFGPKHKRRKPGGCAFGSLQKF